MAQMSEPVYELLNEMRRMGRLPALDQNVAALCRLAEKTDTQSADLTAIIMRDPALTAAMLSVANSAAYRPLVPIKTVSSAVTHLGFEKVQSLALGLTIFKKSKENARNRELYRLFLCSYFTGTISLSLARQANYENPEEAFAAGLLSQLPRLLLANCFPERYAEMERLVVKDRLSLNQACQKVFNGRYVAIAHGIAVYWNLPENFKQLLLMPDGDPSKAVTIIRLASEIADMLFGNLPAGAEPMAEAEKRMQKLLQVSDFPLQRFLVFTYEADENLSKFFNLGRDDIEMMYKIAEWGKANAAEVAANLTDGIDVKDPVPLKEDPRVLISHYLSELMLAVRKRTGVNEILMVAQEAIYRCIGPTCVFTAFLDTARSYVVGRLYAGNLADVQAGDFKFNMSDKTVLATQAMESGQTLYELVKGRRLLPRPELLQRLGVEYAVLAPIVVSGRAIGIYFVGRAGEAPFSPDERIWLEAIAGHVGMAFENEQMKKTTG